MRWVPKVSTLYETRPQILRELRRARRHERPLTLLTLAPDGGWRRATTGRPTSGLNGTGEPDVDPRAPLPEGALHFDFLFVGLLLRNTLRETDLVALSCEGPEYAVLLPETGEKEGHAAAIRLGREICCRVVGSVNVGAARFPLDGFTIEELLCSARDALQPWPPDPGTASDGFVNPTSDTTAAYHE